MTCISFSMILYLFPATFPITIDCHHFPATHYHRWDLLLTTFLPMDLNLAVSFLAIFSSFLVNFSATSTVSRPPFLPTTPQFGSLVAQPACFQKPLPHPAFHALFPWWAKQHLRVIVLQRMTVPLPPHFHLWRYPFLTHLPLQFGGPF